MTIISRPLAPTHHSLPEIFLQVPRLTLAKRRWRGLADDGREFGFELDAPLYPGIAIFQNDLARYTIAQIPEPVLTVSLDLAPSAAAGIGWAIGNLHLELSAEPTQLVAADEPAVRQLLERLKIPFLATNAVFRPGRFARGPQPSSELGPSHRH